MLNNLSINNAGSSAANNGITIGVIGNGQLDLMAQTLTINGAAGSGVQMLFDTNNTQQVSRVMFDNVLIQTPGANAMNMSVLDDSWVDFRVTNSTMIGAGGANASGMVINVDGNNNTFARLFLQNNTIAGFQGNGVNMLTAGDSHTLATFDGNVIGATTFNGAAINGNGSGTDITNLPYFDGINIAVTENSIFNGRFVNNRMNDNFERSLDIQTSNNGVANILLVGNAFGSDFGEDAPPAQTSNLDDMDITNGVGGTICLAMSNNTFQWPAFVFNPGNPTAFTLELDGLTNGIGVPTIVDPVTLAPFGTFCEPAIAAEEALFISKGFDP